MSIILMILLLSILILVHEAGHFLAAKMFKMKVAKFGFGLPIGPTLWEGKVGDVKVLVHAFLLGGYVAFPDDEKDEEGDDILPKDSPDRFMNRPIYQRLVVVSAGVVANILCAFAFVFLTAAFSGHLPSGKYNVFITDIVAPKSESVWQSGMEKGDKVVEINGTKIDSNYGLLAYAQLSKKNDGKTDEMYINKNYENLKKINPAFAKDEIIPKDVTIKLPKPSTENPIILNQNQLRGIEKYKDTQIALDENQKKLRDELVNKKFYTSNGEVTLNDIAYAVSDNVRPVTITVEREGKLVQLKPVYPNKDGMIGVQFDAKEILIPTTNVKSIVSAGNTYLYDNTYMLLYGLKQIVTGKIPITDLHGVVLITKIGGDKIKNEGKYAGLLLAAIISLDLAIVNFLPIPALDGGHVMFLLIEKLRGRPLDEQTIDKIGTVCFMLLIGLMVFVLFNDVYVLTINSGWWKHLMTLVAK